MRDFGENVEIHQLVPTLESGDAIGNYALRLREVLRGEGLRSDIYVFRSSRELAGKGRHYLEHRRRSSSDNVLIYHYSIASPVTSYFASAADRKIMIYHNITPERFFAGISDEVYYMTKAGRCELARLSGVVDLAIGDSEYNANELKEMGFENVKVAPVPVDFSGEKPVRVDRSSEGWANFRPVRGALHNR